jgi:hypothetical protein
MTGRGRTKRPGDIRNWRRGLPCQGPKEQSPLTALPGQKRGVLIRAPLPGEATRSGAVFREGLRLVDESISRPAHGDLGPECAVGDTYGRGPGDESEQVAR